MAIIRMKYTLLDEITRYATGHLPEEACGLIAGSEDENGRLIEKVYYLTNVDRTPEGIRSHWIRKNNCQQSRI